MNSISTYLFTAGNELSLIDLCDTCYLYIYITCITQIYQTFIYIYISFSRTLSVNVFVSCNRSIKFMLIRIFHSDDINIIWKLSFFIQT